jgi:hypothetical protein
MAHGNLLVTGFPTFVSRLSGDEVKEMFEWVGDANGECKIETMEFRPIDVCKNVSFETREAEFQLVRFDREMGMDAILAELDKRDFRPAVYQELLAFAQEYPKPCIVFRVIALGSVWDRDGNLHCPMIYSRMYCGQALSPWNISSKLYERDRFLVVRK